MVLNSLRLVRLGRSGLAAVRAPRIMSGRRGVVASVLLPIVLFAGFTLASQAISPARGQSLLPELPSITTINLPHGGSAEMYLDPGAVGVNEFHLIFSGSASNLAAAGPRVTARQNGGTPQVLRQLRVSTGHYIDFVVLDQGTWTFHVATRFGGSPASFDFTRTVP